MAQTAHTPGPWEAVDRSGAGWQIDAHLPVGVKLSGIARPLTGGEPAFMIFTLRETLTIQIADERWVQFGTGYWDDMQAANARLIAAAPELLAVLQEALDVNGCDVRFGPAEDEQSWCAVARAIIAKAKAAP